MKNIAFALILLFLPLLGNGSARAEQGEDMESVRVAAGQKLAQELDQLAAFCQENKLYLGRDTCYRLLLRFEPDHQEARSRLKYRKNGASGCRAATARRRIATTRWSPSTRSRYERSSGITSRR